VSLTPMVFLAFAAGTIAVVALALLIRDLSRPNEDLLRRLGLALEEIKASPETPILGEPTGNRIDRTFYRLVEDSGSPLDGQTALAVVAGMAVVGCAVPLVLLENLLAAAAGLLVGVSLPLCWWMIRRIRRLRALQKNLPETLELLADGVRAGQSLEQASELVALQAPAPLNQEFDYCARQLQLGHTPVAVLNRMARRIPLPEFRIFATAVLVHRQTGGNLALLAQRLAGSARDRSEFQGHVKAVTAGSRLSVIGLVVGTVLALGILASMQTEYLGTFVEHELGPTLLVTAAILQIVGILWVWRILRVHF